MKKRVSAKQHLINLHFFESKQQRKVQLAYLRTLRLLRGEHSPSDTYQFGLILSSFGQDAIAQRYFAKSFAENRLQIIFRNSN